MINYSDKYVPNLAHVRGQEEEEQRGVCVFWRKLPPLWAAWTKPLLQQLSTPQHLAGGRLFTVNTRGVHFDSD